jgi:hypothetical protein
MLMKQPFYIRGIEDVELCKGSAFGAAGAFLFTFLLSTCYMIQKGRPPRTISRSVHEEDDDDDDNHDDSEREYGRGNHRRRQNSQQFQRRRRPYGRVPIFRDDDDDEDDHDDERLPMTSARDESETGIFT